MRFGRAAIFALAFGAGGQAAAQDHGTHHGDHLDHTQMGHGDDAPEEPVEPEATSQQEIVDHSTMDHGAMDHAAMGHTPMPNGDAASAERSASGPIDAADAVWGAAAMRPSRQALYAEHGAARLFWFQADRLEASTSGEGEGFLWDLQAYYGGDIHKLWLKSEGEGDFDEGAEEAEIQALYSRAIAPFFDLQAGIRQDLTGPERTYAVIGLQGLAPYEFEVDAAAFLSSKGDLTARIEAEYDQRMTQRVILQPRLELELAAQDIPELGTGGGVSSLEAGLRLRYEITPEFAPYLGLEQAWKFGRTADFARIAGEDTKRTSYLVGVRFWF